jgi:photosystem II stability/assembly factor-like uncharacterized protein
MGLSRLLTSGSPETNYVFYDNDGSPPIQSGWNTLKLGGGGFLTRLDLHSDGSQVTRADVFGFYGRANTSLPWTQLLTIDSMPAGEVGLDSNGDLIGAIGGQTIGGYEIVIAPSNSSVLYAMWNNSVWKSTNRGTTWTETNWTATAFEPNHATYRMFGPHMAVSPTNADHVIAIAPTAVRKTTDGGATWTTVSGVTVPNGDAGGVVAFDPQNANNVYIGTSGTGVYRSTTGISGTFTLTSSGPTAEMQGMDHDDFGRLWVCSGAFGGAAQSPNLWRFTSGAWAQVDFSGDSNNNRAHSVAVNPNDQNDIYVQVDSGNLAVTTNGGSSWSLTFFADTDVVPNITWFGVTNHTYRTAGNIKFTPAGRLYFADGIGIWYSDSPGAATAWTEDTPNIEELVVQHIISPPNGDPIVGVQDRGFMTITDFFDYPETHGIDLTQALQQGWACAYAISDPTYIYGVTFTGAVSGLQVGKSTNGGASWTVMTPPGVTTLNTAGIAVSTPTNAVIIGSGDNANVRYTTNGGTSWATSTCTGLPTSGETGFGGGYYGLSRHIVCADSVTANKFYFYSVGTASSSASAGLWVSTDSGANFTRAKTGLLDVSDYNDYARAWFNAQLLCAPSNTGHLYFSSGNGDGGNDQYLMRSTDAGVNWTRVTGIVEPKAIGFGATKPGGTYPSFYFVGYANGTYGVWRSDDINAATPTFTLLEDYPLGRVDIVTTVCGDMNTWNKCYVGFQGSGAVFYEP